MTYCVEEVDSSIEGAFSKTTCWNALFWVTFALSFRDVPLLVVGAGLGVLMAVLFPPVVDGAAARGENPDGDAGAEEPAVVREGASPEQGASAAEGPGGARARADRSGAEQETQFRTGGEISQGEQVFPLSMN